MGADSSEVSGALQRLESIVGAADVWAWESVAADWQTQMRRAIAPGVTVAGLVMPTSVEALSAVLQVAEQCGWQVIPAGTGSKLDWGGLVQAGRTAIVVSTKRLDQLIDHAIGDLTVTVEAGMPFATLQAILAQKGQFLAIDPAFPEHATIGGIVATGDTGSLRHRYNSVRDMLLGLTFVRADGQVAKAGGRVVKNVAGYDLMKLLTGSYGTLGVITQVTFRVYPLPAAAETVVLTGAATAIAQLAASLSHSVLTPTSLDILSESVVAALALGQGTGLAVRFQSIESSVQEQREKLLHLGRSLNLTTTTYAGADEAALWQQLQERMTQVNPEAAIACKIGITPTAAIALYQYLDTLSLPTWFAQLHGATGLGRLVVTSSFDRNALMQIRAFCQTQSGFLSVLQAPVEIKQTLDVWGYSGNALDVMRSLKRTFDAKHLLNPGRFVGGI